MRDISAVVITRFQGQTQEPCHKSERFFIFLFTAVAKRSFFNVAGFLDPSFDCDEFVLKHVKSSRLVPATLLYLYIFEKVFEKARETSETGSIL